MTTVYKIRNKDTVKHPLLEEQIAELLGDEGNYEYTVTIDKLVVTNKKSRITEEYKIVNGNELIKPTCPYCRTPIEDLDSYWDDHVTCDND